MNPLEDFRQDVDHFMKHSPHSPIRWEERRTFEALSYFPYNPSLAFVVEAERFPADEPPIEMQTSTGDMRLYQRWGRINFSVEGEEVSLVIYADLQHGDFFLPFKDATNGQETYGAGRYLDTHRPGLRHLRDDQIEIDFNGAYNPYCAYNENYSCPLPPRENWMKVEVRAGEMAFDLGRD